MEHTQCTGLVGTLTAFCHPPVPWLRAGGSLCWLPCPGCSLKLNFLCAGQCQFCPVGWLWDAGWCYYFSSGKKSWEQSREDCCSRGAQLVTIRANTTLVSAPSLACATHCRDQSALVTTSRSLRRDLIQPSPVSSRLLGSGPCAQSLVKPVGRELVMLYLYCAAPITNHCVWVLSCTRLSWCAQPTCRSSTWG